MSLKEIKDKLEIGLKPDAPYRPTNLPESEQADQADAETDGTKRVPEDPPPPASGKRPDKRADDNEG